MSGYRELAAPLLARSIQPTRLAVCYTACLALINASPAWSESRKSKQIKADEFVQKALREEIAGSDGMRTRYLSTALLHNPSNEDARWLSGQVRRNKRWVDVDAVPKIAASSRLLANYRRLRSTTRDTAEAQLALANWCARVRLFDQERAHLTRVVEREPDFAEARVRLGFQKINGRWVSREELQESTDREALIAQAARKHRKLLTRIAAAAADGEVSDFHKQQLAEIQDPAAIPIMEQLLAGSGAAGVQLLVDQLCNMESHEAAAVLARYAAFADWEHVQKMATAELGDRPKESYVPVLLAELRTPVSATSEVVRNDLGQVVVRRTMTRETQSADEQAITDITFLDPTGNRFASFLAARAASSQAENNVMTLNSDIESRNARVYEVLATTTGHAEAKTPQDWWRWWNDVNGVFVAGGKPTRSSYQQQQSFALASIGGERIDTRVVSPTQTSEVSNVVSESVGFACDCLAAGTNVWTETGPMAIENIRRGDRVLSQDSETGELAYKPVLGTTIRPVSRLVRTRILGESIICSAGHPFWIAGDGWIKAEQLQEGMRFHAVGGTTTIESVEPAHEAVTYNLIVADFHSYFVGENKVLSHDNTIRRPTNTLVPGLKR